MPAFEALDHYHPALIVLLGLATFAGVLGTGLRLLRALQLRPGSPWEEVVAALLGIASLGLGAQLLGMLFAGARALTALWGAFVVVGSVELLSRARRLSLHLPRPDAPAAWLLVGVFAAGAAMDLLVAAAPSTKIDEIYYQMLVSARMVLDGGLVFYLQPWAAAVLPQMGYGIATAPLHALGTPDAPNVLAWCLSLLLSWLGLRLVLQETGSRTLALLAAAGVQLGVYPSVFHTTGGTHALGDLATAASVLALVFSDRLLRTVTPSTYLGMLSICCVVCASAKVSLLPLAGLILLLGAAKALRAAPGGTPRLVLVAALPWIFFYLPLCLWTLWQSGSPFGPMLANVLAPSVYTDAVQSEIAGSRAVNQRGLVYILVDYVKHYPLVFPAGALAALLLPSADSSRRFVLGGLLVVQLFIIAMLLPHTTRFLSGLHHALFIVGLIQVAPYAERWLARPRLALALMGVLTLPWLGAQAYRTWLLGSVALGLDDLEAYERRYIALYDDLRALDRILPEDAVLYSRQTLPVLYFPRPVYMHGRDLPEGKRAFALLAASPLLPEDQDCAYMRLPAGCRYGEPVYVNPRAHDIVFRTPGHEPETARLEVREILGPEGSPPRT